MTFMFNNLLQLLDKFQTEQECIEYFVNVRWNGNVVCPHCGCNKVYKFADKKRFKCKEKQCSLIFSYKTGTFFENTKISFRKWFLAIYINSSHKKGISSHQLARDISVTQKTAWFMLQRIREMMSNNVSVFTGTTEIDEAYIGGSESNKHSNKKGKTDKVVILGMVERETKQVKAVKVESSRTYDLQPTIYETVQEGSVILTDSYSGYDVLDWNYKHETVKHCVGEYVKTSNRISVKIHTNTIEGFWSLLKRGINGTYHWVSKKHIQRYLNEFSFRYSQREITDGERFILSLTQSNGRLKYKQLISA
jgi:transposase-like protein